MSSCPDVPYQAGTVNHAQTMKQQRLWPLRIRLVWSTIHATRNEMVEITVAVYLAGMVNHATMDETMKITNYFEFARGFAWISDSAMMWTERG